MLRRLTLLALFLAVALAVACEGGSIVGPDDTDGAATLTDGGALPQDLAVDDLSVAADLSNGCPPGMVRINDFCVDAYEAYVVELDQDGNELPHSPFHPVDGLTIRAKVAPGVMPQGYISQVQASDACRNAGKRLCTAEEFALACRGTDPADYYPYGGQTKQAGACNEGKGSSVARFFGSNPANWTYANFNDPRLNQWDGGLAPGGSYPNCRSPFGVYDCVGNLHEWGADPPDANGRGRFRGGFYGDAEINGHGCRYVTSAHGVTYHDYSTGFRCCADAP
jgi:sulfatase modifying factor 1